MPNLLPSERDWLRQHPDPLMSPDNQQRLQVAFYDAERKGIKRGSPEYFEHFSERLGHTPRQTEPSHEEPKLRIKRTSRSALRDTETRVTLSKEQRDAGPGQRFPCGSRHECAGDERLLVAFIPALSCVVSERDRGQVLRAPAWMMTKACEQPASLRQQRRLPPFIWENPLTRNMDCR